MAENPLGKAEKREPRRSNDLLSGGVVWLLTSGDGSDGDAWNVHSIHATEEGAISAKAEYEKLRTRPDGSTYFLPANIELWDVFG